MDATVNKTASRYRFLQQVIQLAGPYWQSEEKLRVWILTAGLFFLTLAQVGMAIWINYWNRELFDALQHQQLTRFYWLIGIFAIIFLSTMAITALHLHVKRKIELGWRQWLTRRLINHWMAAGHHYQLLFSEGEHDNPDGRIAEDIRIATSTAVMMAHTLIYSLFILISFINILSVVSGSMSIPGTSLTVPYYMVVMAFVYAGAGSWLGWHFGKPLVKATNDLQTAEADFRFDLARARENSESIALMRGELVERENSIRFFDRIAWFFNRQSFAYMGIVSFSSGYGALLPVFPILIAAPQFIAGTMTLGVLMQAAQAFEKLTSALSWPIDHLGDMATCRASAERVLTLYNDVLKLEKQAVQNDECRIRVHYGDERKIIVRDLSIASPEGRLLFENLSLEIHRGERILIGGDPAVVISFFKVLAGLWPWGKGEVLLPAGQSIVFMPQRPYLPDGTLRAALTYPAADEAFDDRAIQHALECAGLLWIVPRLDEIETWEKALPLRTQQRLAFARLFLHKPCWIFMEEATDAFDPRGEECMMQMLIRELPNSTLLTIGFHKTLELHNTRKLVLGRMAETRYLFRADGA